MGEAKTGAEFVKHEFDERRDKLDPGAYIGSEPELAADRIPGGVQPEDERVAANSSQHGAKGEPASARPIEGDPAPDGPAPVDPDVDS